MYDNQFCKTMEQIGKQLAACNRKIIASLSRSLSLHRRGRECPFLNCALRLLMSIPQPEGNGIVGHCMVHINSTPLAGEGGTTFMKKLQYGTKGNSSLFI